MFFPRPPPCMDFFLLRLAVLKTEHSNDMKLRQTPAEALRFMLASWLAKIFVFSVAHGQQKFPHIFIPRSHIPAVTVVVSQIALLQA